MATPSRATRAFFSFPQVLDGARHRDYNAWHQLDHRPENLALPGVVHGERWVRTPACRAASDVDVEPTLSAAQYVATYWFAEPAAPAVEEWYDLGETTRQEGRRPELGWTARRLTGFFRPVRGHVDPAVRISVDALPFRPARGVLLEVQRVDESVGGAALDEALRRLHVEHVPAVVALPGVTGSWTFASRRLAVDPVSGGGPGVGSGSGSGALGESDRLRITLHWCEGDPLEVAERVSALPSPDAAGLTTLLRTPLETITPWQWDWFDR